MMHEHNKFDAYYFDNEALSLLPRKDFIEKIEQELKTQYMVQGNDTAIHVEASRIFENRLKNGRYRFYDYLYTTEDDLDEYDFC